MRRKIYILCCCLLGLQACVQAQLVGLSLQGGYGWLSAPVENKQIDNMVNALVHGSGSGPTSIQSDGAFNAGIQLKLAKVTLGCLGVFETTHSLKNFSSAGRPGWVATRNKYATYMGRLQWNYIGVPWMHLYGGLAAGISNTRTTVTGTGGDSGPKMGQQSGSRSFAYQISPLGLTIGKKISVYGEVGYGWLGIFNVGLRFRW